MQGFIRFFLEVGNLKTISRRGWVLRGVKDPETVADHAFRVTVIAWLLGRRAGINVKRLLKVALVHSLSAVYIEYISPYDKLLETRSKKELLKKYPALLLRAPVTEKGKVASQRFKEEKEAIKRLIKGLPEDVQQEIFHLWLDFQEKTSKEAKLVWGFDRLENLLQALEYKDQLSAELLAPFLQQVDEFSDEPIILQFGESINEYFKKGPHQVKNKRNLHLIKFLLDIGKLKKIKRVGWVYGGVKEEETESVAGHSFRLALISWLLAGKRRFDLEAILKIAILHDFMIVYSGDITPFDRLVTGNFDHDKRILEMWPIIGSREDKEHRTVERRVKERKGFDKLLKVLPMHMRDEILSLWFEYEEGFSKEGRFVRQADRIEKLLQAIVYHLNRKYKPEIDPYWIQLKTLVDDPVLVDFVEQVDQGFYGKDKLISKLVDNIGRT